VNVNRKSQRAFVTITLMTVFSVSIVLIVYAALLGTISGPGEVTVGGVGGDIYYSIDNVIPGTWTTSIGGSGQPINVGAAWYARWVTSAGYTGPITIIWQLQQKQPDTSWADIVGKTASTTSKLNGTLGEFVYATATGGAGSTNHNWGSDITTQGTYRITATVSTG
jgi:hypothetical protein